MARVLVVCSSTDGHTVRICDRLQRILAADGHRVTRIAIAAAGVADPEGFDRVVVGASVRYGRHDARVLAFANRHAPTLNAMPSAFFSVNLTARKAAKGRAESNPYVLRFLHQVDWRPAALEVFAGKLDYPRYGFVDRAIIRLIMLLTGGPTDPRAVVDYTDWRRVEAFGRRLSGAAPVT